MDDVVHFPEHQQSADIKHMVWSSANEPSHHAQQQVDDAEDKTERARGARGSGEAKVQSDCAGDDVDQVMSRRKMCAQQIRHDEATNADQHKDSAQDLANCFCHDLSFSSCENLNAAVVIGLNERSPLLVLATDIPGMRGLYTNRQGAMKKFRRCPPA